jgi:DNA-binding NtrC family response regulator
MPESRKTQRRILVVDDSAETLEVLERNLGAAGYKVYVAARVAEAMDVLASTPVDLVITDLKMPGPSGLDLLRFVRQNYADIEVMMITGYATVEGAVEAVKSGAEEYLQKPFTSEELLAAVARALDKQALRWATRSPSTSTPRAPPGFVGEHPTVKQLYAAIAKAAPSTATVLITGESGTGKELVARAMHYGGQRAASRFVTVNCGGIPESLLESELFGYVKGAFTGANETRAGFFQTADGGTIFLDEISEMSLGMQVKLLRVLQEKEVCMVGSNRSRKIDVRILAATNKDLPMLMEKGQFREDLYYRLNVITIAVPPLRARGDDLLRLIAHFTDKHARDNDRRTPRFSEDALRLLRDYRWPGNVRELENVVQGLVVMTDGEVIRASDIPALMRCDDLDGSGFDRSLAEVEAEYIRNVLAHVGGNKTRAAAILGIDRKTLRDKLKRAADG